MRSIKKLKDIMGVMDSLLDELISVGYKRKHEGYSDCLSVEKISVCARELTREEGFIEILGDMDLPASTSDTAQSPTMPSSLNLVDQENELLKKNESRLQAKLRELERKLQWRDSFDKTQQLTKWLREVREQELVAVEDMSESNETIDRCDKDAESFEVLLAEDDMRSQASIARLQIDLETVKAHVADLEQQNEAIWRAASASDENELDRVICMLVENADENGDFFSGFIFADNQQAENRALEEYLIPEFLIKQAKESPAMFYSRLFNRMSNWERPMSEKEVGVLGNLAFLAMFLLMIKAFSRFHVERLLEQFDIDCSLILLICQRRWAEVKISLAEYEKHKSWKKLLYIYRAMEKSCQVCDEDLQIPNYFD